MKRTVLLHMIFHSVRSDCHLGRKIDFPVIRFHPVDTSRYVKIINFVLRCFRIFNTFYIFPRKHKILKQRFNFFFVTSFLLILRLANTSSAVIISHNVANTIIIRDRKWYIELFPAYFLRNSSKMVERIDEEARRKVRGAIYRDKR